MRKKSISSNTSLTGGKVGLSVGICFRDGDAFAVFVSSSARSWNPNSIGRNASSTFSSRK